MFDKEFFDQKCQERENLNNAKIEAQKRIDNFRSTLSPHDHGKLGWPVCVFERECEPNNTFNECRYHSDQPRIIYNNKLNNKMS